MKTTNRVLVAITVAVVSGLGSAALAGSRLSGNDGIAASPRVRMQMNERRATEVVFAPVYIAPPTIVYQGIPAPGVTVTASPRVDQTMDNDWKVSTAGVVSSPTIATTVITSGDDGIVASPRLRMQMNERPQEIEIVPVE